MDARDSQRKDKPFRFALLTVLLALLATGGVLAWAAASPERVLIGLKGRHDGQGGSRRLADCLDCHVPFVGTPSSRCLGPGCHGELATGTPPRDGAAMPIRFHVALRDQPCGACHEEHQTPATSILARREFTHAIIPKAARERCIRCHSGAGQKSHPATDAVSCDLCHATKAWTAVRIQHARVQQHPCDLCHVAPATEVHASIAGACTECHGTETWAAERPTPLAPSPNRLLRPVPLAPAAPKQ